MEDAVMKIKYIQGLRGQVHSLTSACRELDAFLVNGANLLNRGNDVERAEKSAASLLERLDSLEQEDQRRSIEGHDIDQFIESGVAILGLLMTGRNRGDIMNKTIKEMHASRKCYLGTIVVRVGVGGFPDDVSIIPVSRIAREESEVMRELRQQGGVLFSPKNFRQMLPILIDNLREGKLRLPILLEQLPLKLAIPLELIFKRLM
jgi:hypothetical protein